MLILPALCLANFSLLLHLYHRDYRLKDICYMLDFTIDPSSLYAEKAPSLRASINTLYLCDEQDYVQDLIDQFPDTMETSFAAQVSVLINGMREHNNHSILHQLLQEYDLSTDEGITLMCLAESLIRIPDTATANDLLIDKLSKRGWQHHVNKSESFWVNAASWGLAISGKMLNKKKLHPSEAVEGLVNKLTMNITREAVTRSIRMMSEQFIFAQNPDEAIENAKHLETKQQCCSFDMLGEEALTEDDAQTYMTGYIEAIETVATGNSRKQLLKDNISIKLSALHPRYEPSQQHKVLPELVNRLLVIAKKARQLNVPITVDAEEQYRLDILLQVFESVLSHQDLNNWGHFGLAVQAYGKRAMSTLHWLHALGDKLKKNIPVRLVKGAYWDSEIKWAQEIGLEEYPVFTQKASTDLNYMACSHFLLNENQKWLRPRFATHNAWTVNYILSLNSPIPFEFQRLHGMGESLFDQVCLSHNIPCRIYAPIGVHAELLPYLVRRLIENGANSSFVFQVQDPLVPMHSLTEHPADYLVQSSISNPNIPLPKDIFVDYPNSLGIELQHDNFYYSAMDKILPFHEEHYQALPIVNGQEFHNSNCREAFSPVDGESIGEVFHSDQTTLEFCIEQLKTTKFKFDDLEDITMIVERAADIFEKNKYELVYLCMKESGKTLNNAFNEIRETIDYCRYYSRQAQKNFSDPAILDTITGEENLLKYRPRGNVLCISPWNFPLSIFVGQIAAALSCGNRVLAKPAQQTCIVAQRAIEILYEAGISHQQLYFLPGVGAEICETLIKENVIDMVVFTGSNITAKQIQKWLIEYDQRFIPILAETGGQNFMLADSTVQIDQLVKDVITSAFDSCGQRCSALRVLYIQEDIKDVFYSALKGRLSTLNIESPFLRDTDFGPVIDQPAKLKLIDHIDWLNKNAKFIAKCDIQNGMPSDQYIEPCAYEINNLTELTQEHFGPILHVIPFQHDDINKTLEQINKSGFGLTLGIHSRNESWIEYITDNATIGNIYINRNMIGAKVGAQPFGGHGLSGTGPKSGGPAYLHAFVKEYTVTTNKTAFGGNQDLLS
ncbi:MAG: RHH-type proline utilization regulon transcriptional repressor/proline dehydrogenase [Psychrobacter glaciei]